METNSDENETPVDLRSLYLDLLSKSPDEEYDDFSWQRAAETIVTTENYPAGQPLPMWWRPVFVEALLEAAKQAHETQFEAYEPDFQGTDWELTAGADRPLVRIKRVRRREGFVPADSEPLVSVHDAYWAELCARSSTDFKQEYLIQSSYTAVFWLRQRAWDILAQMLKEMLEPVERDATYIRPLVRGRGKWTGRHFSSPEDFDERTRAAILELKEKAHPTTPDRVAEILDIPPDTYRYYLKQTRRRRWSAYLQDVGITAH